MQYKKRPHTTTGIDGNIIKNTMTDNMDITSTEITVTINPAQTQLTYVAAARAADQQRTNL